MSNALSNLKPTRFLLALALLAGVLGLINWAQTAQTQAKTAYTPTPPAVVKNFVKPGAIIHTSKGDMTVELFPQEAPLTVANFQTLAASGFYNTSMVFHRVVPGFVIQTGDPTGTGSGGSEHTIALEVKNKLIHNGKGVLAMARSVAPDSASSQFYITLKAQPSLDGKYAVFGRVIKGLDVVDRIKQGDGFFGVDLVDVANVKPEAGAPPLNNLSYKFKDIFLPKSAEERRPQKANR